MARNVNIDNSEAISRRFFEAIEVLKGRRALSSLSGFCIERGLSAPRYRALRLAYGSTPKAGYECPYKYVELSALSALVAGYGVDGSWLLTGRGNMFVK
jgi:hypothetical protein